MQKLSIVKLLDVKSPTQTISKSIFFIKLLLISSINTYFRKTNSQDLKHHQKDFFHLEMPYQ